MVDHYFNSILVTGVVPVSFAYGYVIPLLKSSDKDPSVPSNYRGITLTSVVFEHLLLSRLLPYIQLSPLQGGFRAGRSCTHSAFVLQETIAYLRERGRKVYVAFLDARKAFDTVWHEGLFVKLSHAGVPLSLWHILLSWYRQCHSSVLWEHSCFPSFPIRQGVCQGAVLSPLLYSLFVDELLVNHSASGHGVSMDGVYCGALMYADNLVLIADSPGELQALLDIAAAYASKWRYLFNASKSFVLVFGESLRSCAFSFEHSTLMAHWYSANRGV